MTKLFIMRGEIAVHIHRAGVNNKVVLLQNWFLQHGKLGIGEFVEAGSELLRISIGHRLVIKVK